MELDEMSRAIDPSNADMNSGGRDPRGIDGIGVARQPLHDHRAVDAHGDVQMQPATTRTGTIQPAVCPFCGIINDASNKSCRQCGMENNQQTRQNTRGKIGPWFVWQQKNPSAPGMSWATLLSLVEKGRITPRSVVRGPTTGQLWRFAARVKGLSREFGGCWHCGAEVTRTTRMCGSCKRLQQPPLNPDALLDAYDAHTSVPTVSIAGAQQPVQRTVGNGKPAQHAVSLVSEPLDPVHREIPTSNNSHTNGHLAGYHHDPESNMPGAVPMNAYSNASDSNAAETPSTRLRNLAGQSAAEPIRPREPVQRNRAILPPAIATSGIALRGPSSPGLPLHDMSDAEQIDMGEEELPSGMELRAFQLPASRSGSQKTLVKRMALAFVLALMVALPVSYFCKPLRDQYERWYSQGKSFLKSNGSGNVSPENNLTPVASQATDSSQSTNSSKHTGLMSVSTSPRPGNSDVKVGPNNQGDGKSLSSANSSIASGKPAFIAPKNDSSVQVGPPPTDLPSADKRAWEIYNRALDSEKRGDYSSAIKEYDWILQLRLPEGFGPTDVQNRMDLVRKILSDRENPAARN